MPSSIDLSVYRNLISLLKNIPEMLNNKDVRFSLLRFFEEGEKSLLKRQSDPQADLEKIVEHASLLGKLDMLIENAKSRDQNQANRDALDKIKQEIKGQNSAQLSKDNIKNAPTVKPSLFENGYALLVGVGADLPVTVKDATGLKDILTDKGRCAYSEDNVRLLTEKQATRQDILNGLDWLKIQAQDDPQASVIVYFSGHGGYLPDYHLLPFGYDHKDLANTAVFGTEFTEKLRAIQSKKLLILLDCCHAGAMAEVKTAGFVKSPAPPELKEILTEGSGRIMLASSHADEVSKTGDPYSVFTQALRQGLAGYGASKQDGYAYIADIATHVGQVVPRLTDNKQHPMLDFSGADNFVVAYYGGGEKSPKPLPELSAHNILPFDSIDADLVEGYHNILKKLQKNLIAVENQMAEFFDEAAIPLDLKRTQEGIFKRIAETEAKIKNEARKHGWKPLR